MPQFDYKAIDETGRVKRGSTQARDSRHLTDLLTEQGLFLMEAKTAEASPAPKPSFLDAPKEAPKAQPSGAALAHAMSGGKVDLDTLSVFTTQFAIMVRTALPILETLQSLARQQSDPVFRAVIEDVFRSVRAGQTLSSAFGRFPRVFDEVYISLLAAGEASGSLPMMLERISAYLSFRRSLGQKIRSAMLYPSIILLTSLAVVAFLVLFILPTFSEIFQQFEMDLPWLTRVLLAVSAHLRTWWAAYFVAAGVAWWRVQAAIRSPSGARDFDRWVLDLPKVGKLVRAVVLTRVLRTLSALVAGGVPILKALDLARRAAGNAVYDEVMGRVYRSASEGQGLASALGQSAYVPPEIVGMIANSERTGTLPETLQRISDFYESEVDIEIRNLFTALEPLTVAFLGVMVGTIAVAILLPVFSLGQGVQ